MGPFAQRRLYGPKTIDEQLRGEIPAGGVERDGRPMNEIEHGRTGVA